MSTNDEWGEHAYWAHVNQTARDIRQREAEGEDRHDALHEEVDGSAWIIYTHAQLKVLTYSQNDDAVFDSMGEGALDGCTSAGDAYARLAYHAMEQDILEALERLPEDEDGDGDE